MVLAPYSYTYHCGQYYPTHHTIDSTSEGQHQQPAYYWPIAFLPKPSGREMPSPQANLKPYSNIVHGSHSNSKAYSNIVNGKTTPTHITVPKIAAPYCWDATNNKIVLTENDVVFGKDGPIGNAAGTNRLRKIMNENLEAYRKAGQYGRRDVEQCVLEQLKTIPHVRFLQYIPPTGLLAMKHPLVMSDYQVRQAMAEIFGHMMKSQSDHDKEKMALTAANNSTPRLAKEPGTATSSSEGQKKVPMMREQEPSKEISGCQQLPRKDSNPSSKFQEPQAQSNQDKSHLPSCSVVNDETPTKETSITATNTSATNAASPELSVCALATTNVSANSTPRFGEEVVTDGSTSNNTGSRKRASASLLGTDFDQRRKSFQEAAYRRREEIIGAKKVNATRHVSQDDQACQDSNDDSTPHLAQDIDSTTSVEQTNDGSVPKDKSNLQQSSSMGSLPDPVGATLESVEVFHEELTDTTTTGDMDSSSHQQEYSIVSLKEENEELKEEMEQMKMNHAMEIGAMMGGGSGDLSEKVTKLTEDLERAHKTIKELQSESEPVEEMNAELATLRTCNHDLSTTNDRLTDENIKLKQTNDKLERRIAALQNVLAEQMLRQSVAAS